jgi:hypothetical protein
MKFKNEALGLISSAYETFRDTVVGAVQAILDGVKWLYRWHQRLLRTNPGYPIALLTIGKSIVRIATPSSAIAAAGIALLAALLDIGNHEAEPTWDDYDY